MTFVVSPLCRQFFDYIHAASSDWLEDGACLAPMPELTTRKWSFMFRFPIVSASLEQKAILVKVARSQGMNLEQAFTEKSLLLRTEREHEMLTSIARVFAENAIASQPFSFIKPLAFLQDWNALVTEELSCRPLKDYLLSPSMAAGSGDSWKNFELLLRRSAGWLRIYHQGMGEQSVECLKNSGLQERFDEIISHLTGVLSSEKDALIKSKVYSALLGSENASVPMAMLHGDFHCSNLLVTPENKLASLDADCVRGPIYEDIAKLLADLETRSIQMMTNGFFIRSRQMDNLRTAFLNEYFGDTMMPSHNILELFVAIAVLYKWKIDEDVLTQSTGMQKYIRKWVTPWRRYYTLKLILRHLENIGDNNSVMSEAVSWRDA